MVGLFNGDISVLFCKLKYVFREEEIPASVLKMFHLLTLQFPLVAGGSI